MKKVGGFLDKFQKLTPPNDAVRRAVANAVGKVVGKQITKAQVKIQNQVAFIDVSSVVKNKIRLERKEILELIYESIPKGRDLIRDIR